MSSFNGRYKRKRNTYPLTGTTHTHIDRENDNSDCNSSLSERLYVVFISNTLWIFEYLSFSIVWWNIHLLVCPLDTCYNFVFNKIQNLYDWVIPCSITISYPLQLQERKNGARSGQQVQRRRERRKKVKYVWKKAEAVQKAREEFLDQIHDLNTPMLCCDNEEN